MDKDAIKALRAKLGLTQAQFAKKLGVATRTVEDWEREKFPKKPTGLYLKALEDLAKKTEKKEKTT